jgi:hypothetical protein
MDRILHGETRFYQGMLIQCQSYHCDYVCPRDGAIVSGGDGINSSTQLPAVRSAWVTVALSYHARPSVDPAPTAFPGTESHRMWLSRAQVRSKLGHEVDLQWEDR